MRNALLPSVSSQLYGFVNNEFQMPNLDISMQMDSKVVICLNNEGSCFHKKHISQEVLEHFKTKMVDPPINNVHISRNHVHGSGFSMDSRLFSDDSHLRSGGGFANPYQSLVNCQPASHLASTFSSDNMSQQAMVLGYKLIPCSQFEDPFQESRTMKSTRKRAYEINEPSLQEGIDKTALNEWKKNKRKIHTTSMEQIHHQVKEGSSGTQRHSTLQVPVRRSQKLGDKITALQKLVSPYGKTDTASVLQEASLYIKLLQDQIKMMTTSSYDSVTTIQPQYLQNIGEKDHDLKSRGLCLVPVSITQELVTKEDMAHHHVATSRRNVTPRNF